MNKNNRVKHILLLSLLTAFIILFTIPETLLSSTIEIKVLPIGGVYIISSSIEGFNSKLLPATGISLEGEYIFWKNRIYSGGNISMLYAFKSNYEGYYYYGPFWSMLISGSGGLKLLNVGKVSIVAGGILGANLIQTDYDSTQVLSMGGFLKMHKTYDTAVKNRGKKKIPIRFSEFTIRYTHNFIEGFKLADEISAGIGLIIYARTR